MPLVGIARLASESPLLEAKRVVQYFEIPSKSILNRTKPTMPFRWAINPYRGCEFGCRYCYARYTHEFMGMEDGRDFEDRIYAKAHTAELPRRANARPAGSIRAGPRPAAFHHHQIRPGSAGCDAAAGHQRARQPGQRQY